MRRSLPLARWADLASGALPSSEMGLTSAQAHERRDHYGGNDIVEAPGHAWRDLLRETAKDPMIWFFAATSSLYALVGQRVEALTLLAAILPLIGMDLFLHRRTQASIEGLKSRLADRATLVRDGASIELPAVEVVPGDLVIVSSGAAFPADGILVAGEELQVDESTLTGEAFPVVKRPLLALSGGEGEPLVDHEHWGFAGTRLLTGRARLRAAWTGGETLYGEIVRSAASGAHSRTPLQHAIQRLVSVLLVAALALCVLLALVRLRQGHGWTDALVSAVTLAAAALPEEFPVVFTFFLGVGVYRLAKRQVLVRRAVSVENIGRVSTICSDKTGTITEGRLRLAQLLSEQGTDENRLLVLAAAASRRESGDPLDAAIWRHAEKAGVLGEFSRPLATFPFTEGRRRETAIVRDAQGTLLAATKGAPEVVLALSKLERADREEWNRQTARLADEGQRVIACAWRPSDPTEGARTEPPEGYWFAGLLAFDDPPREGVAESVGICRDAGIHAMVVTGDHPLTARAIARQIGLGQGSPTVISGDEMEQRIASGQGQTLRDVDVIARAAPGQKLALVRALQETGEIVAVTGDGVNDVPALRAADIGVAMGERGTRSAREVASIVLLDDNFRTIVGAIGEGRQLFRNLQLAFQYLLMIHIPFVLTAAFIPLAGYPLLYLPIHVIWLEIVIHPTALLVFQELPAGQKLDRTPPPGPARFFTRRDWGWMALTSAWITAMVAGSFLWSLEDGGSNDHARAMALACLTLSSAALTAALSGLRTWASRLISGGTVALSVGLVSTPVLARFLHIAPLHLGDWAHACLGSLAAALLASVSARRSSCDPRRSCGAGRGPSGSNAFPSSSAAQRRGRSARACRSS